MIKRIGKIAAALVLGMTLAACSKPAKEITLGSVSGNTYSNDYFDFEFQVPSGWTILSDEEKMAILQTGTDMINSTGQLNSEIVLKEQNILTLFGATQHDATTGEDATSSMQIIGEKPEALGALVNAKQYLEATSSQFKQLDLGYEIGEINTIKLGAKEFSYMDLSLNIFDFSIQQSYYVAKVNGYFVSIITTNFNGEATDDIKAVMDSMNFK